MDNERMIAAPLNAAEYVQIETVKGDLQERMWLVRTVSMISLFLVLTGAIALLIRPEMAKDLWLILGPILSLIVGAYGSLIQKRKP